MMKSGVLSEGGVEEECGIEGVGGVQVVRDVFSVEGIFKSKPAKLARKGRQKKTYQAMGTALQRPEPGTC